MLLVFRRPDCPYPSAELALRGLDPNTTYELVSDARGNLGSFSGAELSKRYLITLPERHRSDLILYHKK
jgi:hypothetical protein